MTQFNFTRAKVGRSALLCVSELPDTEDAKDPFYELNLLGRYNYNAPDPVKWFSDPEETLRMAVSCIAKYIEPGDTGGPFVALSHEGDVFFDDRPAWTERIPGTGVSKPDARGWGRLFAIRQIGSRLHACGENGQVFVRETRDSWTHLDTSLLHSVADGVDQAQRAPDGFAAAWERRLQAQLRGEREEITFYDINGPAEDDIYLCGIATGHPTRRGRIYHWDGTGLHDVAVRASDALTKILVVEKDEVWVCGRDGQILAGNRREGFRAASGLSGAQMFTAITQFGGKIFLASSGGRDPGLFVHDGNRIERFVTPLKPDVSDVFHVEAIDGSLWTVGRRDVTRFDGTRWERIDHPDNPPVR